LQDPQKFTQIGIFCLKIYHLATLTLSVGNPNYTRGKKIGMTTIQTAAAFRKKKKSFGSQKIFGR
jgi:hypothetical protein